MTGWHSTDVREATPADKGHRQVCIDTQWAGEGALYEVWSYATHMRVDKIKLVPGQLDGDAWVAACQRVADGATDVDASPSRFWSPDMVETSVSEQLGSLAQCLRLIADDLEAS